MPVIKHSSSKLCWPQNQKCLSGLLWGSTGCCSCSSPYTACPATSPTLHPLSAVPAPSPSVAPAPQPHSNAPHLKINLTLFPLYSAVRIRNWMWNLLKRSAFPASNLLSYSLRRARRLSSAVAGSSQLPGPGSSLRPCSYLPEALDSPGLIWGLSPRPPELCLSMTFPRSCVTSPRSTLVHGPSAVFSFSNLLWEVSRAMIPIPLYGPRMAFKFTFLYHELFCWRSGPACPANILRHSNYLLACLQCLCVSFLNPI